MALPTTIDTNIGEPGHHPPYKSSGGAFYSVVNGSVTGELKVYKATDPTDSWTEQDAADNPTTSQLGYATTQDSDVIHIGSWDVNKTYSYHQFNMATDNWDVVDQEIENPTNNPTFPWISIARRASPAATIVVYAGDTDQNMGDKKERVDVNIRPDSTGTWSGPTSLDAGGDIHYGNPNCVLGTNDGIHCIWQRQELSSSPDPPVSWRAYQARTLDSGDSLSTVTIGSTLFSEVHLLGCQNIVSYDDSGTQRITGNAPAGDQQFLRTIVANEDGSDDIDATGSGFAETEATIQWYVNGEVGILSTAELSSDLHLIYSGGGTDGVDQDLYYITSTDNGENWSAPVEEIDGITVNFISTNIYVRGADTVMAYVYDDGGVQKYNEKVLIAGAVAIPPRSLSVLQAVPRMGHY